MEEQNARFKLGVSVWDIEYLHWVFRVYTSGCQDSVLNLPINIIYKIEAIMRGLCTLL